MSRIPMLALALLVAAPAVARAQATTRLIGRVLDSLNAPVAGAQVTVRTDALISTVTSDSGTFALDSVPTGRVELVVRRLGYAPASFVAQLKAGITERVTVRLAGVALELDTVSVEDSVPHPWLRIFDRRRQTGRGVYFTRADIVRSQVQTLGDILRRVPGAQLLRTRTGMEQVVFNRGLVGGRACPPQLFVHTMNYLGMVDDFSPDDVEAMEVYPSISAVPAELQTERAQACGAIVIWTREPPPAPRKKGGG